MASALLASLDARLNPILVKEIRQALRGRYFTVMFWLTVAAATTIGCMMLVFFESSPTEESGPQFFIAMYFCLSIAVHAFVPFGAFLSVGSEWEENTYDLLVLSNLRPRQIVLGKWLSALIQIGLFFSAFGPFLIFAFLLRGLDLSGALLWLAFTALTSSSLAALAIALSSLSRQKFVRMFLMAILAIFLGQTGLMMGIGTFGVLQQNLFDDPDFLQGISGGSIIIAFVALLGAAFGATRFAHPEENRSTLLRVLVTGLTLTALGWLAWFHGQMREPKLLYGFGAGGAVALMLLSLSFCSEEEALGRRVRLQVPRNPLMALLAAPFLPGGGRGMLYLLLNLLLFTAGILAIDRALPSMAAAGGDVKAIALTVVAYGFCYLALPTVLLSGLTRDLAWRVVTRVFVLLFAVGTFVLPTLVGFLLGIEGLAQGQHLGNPAMVLLEIDRLRGPSREFYLLLGLAGVALLVNLPRMLRGLFEVLVLARGGEPEPAPLEPAVASED